MRQVWVAAAWLAALRLLASGAVAWTQLDPSTKFPTAPLSEEVRRAPGDPFRPVMLEVTVLKPEGPGPFPLGVYTPAPGFSGEDTVTIEEVTLVYERRVFPVTISVK